MSEKPEDMPHEQDEVECNTVQNDHKVPEPDVESDDTDAQLNKERDSSVKDATEFQTVNNFLSY